MCRHCERIKEDVDLKPAVHDFMEATATAMTRRYGGAVKFTADDLDATIEVTNPRIRRAALEYRLSHPEVGGTAFTQGSDQGPSDGSIKLNMAAAHILGPGGPFDYSYDERSPPHD